MAKRTWTAEKINIRRANGLDGGNNLGPVVDIKITSSDGEVVIRRDYPVGIVSLEEAEANIAEVARLIIRNTLEAGDALLEVLVEGAITIPDGPPPQKVQDPALVADAVAKMAIANDAVALAMISPDAEDKVAAKEAILAFRAAKAEAMASSDQIAVVKG